MNPVKIHLSPKEWELLQNAEWLLTKNKIIGKVFDLFGDVAHTMRQNLEQTPLTLPVEILAASPKISKGENYRGLPYVMLDYPRYFGKHDIFAIRSFFWWGNFFSVSLHLKGIYLHQYADALQAHFSLLEENDFYICVNDDEWRHDFEEDNLVPLKSKKFLPPETILSDKAFCKLSAKIALTQWNNSEEALLNIYRVIYKALGLSVT